MRKLTFSLVAILLVAGCKHKVLTPEASPEISKTTTSTIVIPNGSFDRYDLKPQVLQKLATGEEILWGGLSGLRFIEQDGYGNLFFWAITDRGPNGAEVKKGEFSYRTFLIPDFHPSLVKLRVNKLERTLEVIESLPLKGANGEFLNGLPPMNREGDKARFEFPVDANNQPIVNQGIGIDSESIAIDDRKHFWVGEEYLPSILEFDQQGSLISHIKPAPKAEKKLKKNQIGYEYRFRKSNRGFEALAYFKDRIYFMPQSPLEVETKPRFIRIGVFNIKTRKYEAEYLYPLENLKIDKIGDMQMLNEKQFILIEQNGEIGSKSVHRIYKVDLNDATNVLKAGFTAPAELTAAFAFPKDFKFTKRTLLLDLVKLGFSEFEKIEGLTLIDDETLAVITDNDFGLDGAKVVPRPTALGIFKFKNKD